LTTGAKKHANSAKTQGGGGGGVEGTKRKKKLRGKLQTTKGEQNRRKMGSGIMHFVGGAGEKR